jgi:hypothetical protein
VRPADPLVGRSGERDIWRNGTDLLSVHPHTGLQICCPRSSPQIPPAPRPRATQLSGALMRFSPALLSFCCGPRPGAAPKLSAFDDPYASIEAQANSPARQPWKPEWTCPRSSCQPGTGRSSREGRYGFPADGEFEYGVPAYAGVRRIWILVGMFAFGIGSWDPRGPASDSGNRPAGSHREGEEPRLDDARSRGV